MIETAMERNPDTFEREYKLFNHSLGQFYHIADQHLRIFNFYILVSVASVGAGVKLYSDGEALLLTFLGLGQIFIGTIFFLLETRNKSLLNNVTEAMLFLEKKHFPDPSLEPLKTFTKDLRRRRSAWETPLARTYGENLLRTLLRRAGTFGSVFVITCALQILVGVGAIVLAPNLVEEVAQDEGSAENKTSE